MKMHFWILAVGLFRGIARLVKMRGRNGGSDGGYPILKFEVLYRPVNKGHFMGGLKGGLGFLLGWWGVQAPSPYLHTLV